MGMEGNPLGLVVLVGDSDLQTIKSGLKEVVRDGDIETDDGNIVDRLFTLTDQGWGFGTYEEEVEEIKELLTDSDLILALWNDHDYNMVAGCDLIDTRISCEAECGALFTPAGQREQTLRYEMEPPFSCSGNYDWHRFLCEEDLRASIAYVATAMPDREYECIACTPESFFFVAVSAGATRIVPLEVDTEPTLLEPLHVMRAQHTSFIYKGRHLYDDFANSIGMHAMSRFPDYKPTRPSKPFLSFWDDCIKLS